MERLLQENSRAVRAEPRVRASRCAQQVGTPEGVHDRQRLPGDRRVSRLLAAVSSPETAAVEQMKPEILRVKFDEQLRTQKRKKSTAAVEGNPATGLRPWRGRR